MKRKQKKIKNNSNIDISYSSTHRYEYDTIDITQGDYSSDQKLNDDEFSEFDDELDCIRDQQYHGKKSYK